MSFRSRNCPLESAGPNVGHRPPSPGTPGEGRGEDFRTAPARGPHPNPLPEYRAGEQDAAAFSRRRCLEWAATAFIAAPAILRAACPCGDDDKDAKDHKDDKPGPSADA